MALHVPKAPGFAQMLKDGAKHFSGLEEAVYRNIQACKELAQTTRTAYGPNGMNKMVINRLEKLFVTNDAATILRELEVQHPAAKMIVMASHMQEQEVGDGTNFVLVFAGALLELAEELLRIGLSVSEVISGYEIACKKAHEILPELVCCSAKNLRDVDEVTSLLRTSIMSKQYGSETFLAKLIAQACVSIFPDSGNFNVDNIRVCKILGSGIYSSSVLHGMVFKKETEGDVTSVKDAKIAVYSCPFDGMITETKPRRTQSEYRMISAESCFCSSSLHTPTPDKNLSPLAGISAQPSPERKTLCFKKLSRCLHTYVVRQPKLGLERSLRKTMVEQLFSSPTRAPPSVREFPSNSSLAGWHVPKKLQAKMEED